MVPAVGRRNLAGRRAIVRGFVTEPVDVLIPQPRSLAPDKRSCGANDGVSQVAVWHDAIEVVADLPIPDRFHGASISVTRGEEPLDLFDPAVGEPVRRSSFDSGVEFGAWSIDTNEAGLMARLPKGVFFVPGALRLSGQLEHLQRSAHADEVVGVDPPTRCRIDSDELGVQLGAPFGADDLLVP